MPINEQIRAKQMLVIGPKGEQLGVKSKDEALTLASYAGFDLVLMKKVICQYVNLWIIISLNTKKRKN